MLLFPPRVIAIVLVVAFTCSSAFAQPANRGVALLDLEARNGDTLLSGVFSASHILNVAGVDYTLTTNFDLALEHAMIFCSSKLLDRTFDPHEEQALEAYVRNGGVIVAPPVEDQELHHTFGITGHDTARSAHIINLNCAADSDIFRWNDEEIEQSLSLSHPRYNILYKTYSYELDHAKILGTYPGNKPAIISHDYGKGAAYSFGLNWKELILRNQSNRDFEAQRSGSNTFEATQDAFMLMIRGIYLKHIPYATWKHTSPGASTSSLLVTHDIDSETGMDSSGMFSQYERAHSITATYNVTVRYFSDHHMADYYMDQDENLSQLVEDGHVIGSHSVGHFADFGDLEIFPVGHAGNTRENYTPFFDGDYTHGGSVFGECEVSKQVLEHDLNTKVNVFRPGHLAYPQQLPDVLDSLGYQYSSGFTSPDVMTYFPYWLREGRSFNGKVTDVIEMPVSISDVFKNDKFSDKNYLEKADIWLDLIGKIDANGAPTTLLIHPNRGYKLTAMQYFLERIPKSIQIVEMTEFGQYWRDRAEVEFSTQLNDEALTIEYHHPLSAISSDMSMVIHNGQALKSIQVKDLTGHAVPFETVDWHNNDMLVYPKTDVITAVNDPESSKGISTYPNPSDGVFHLKFDAQDGGQHLLEIVDLHGKIVHQQWIDFSGAMVDISDVDQGIYTARMWDGQQVHTQKLTVLK